MLLRLLERKATLRQSGNINSELFITSKLNCHFEICWSKQSFARAREREREAESQERDKRQRNKHLKLDNCVFRFETPKLKRLQSWDSFFCFFSCFFPGFATLFFFSVSVAVFIRQNFAQVRWPVELFFRTKFFLAAHCSGIDFCNCQKREREKNTEMNMRMEFLRERERERGSGKRIEKSTPDDDLQLVSERRWREKNTHLVFFFPLCYAISLTHFERLYSHTYNCDNTYISCVHFP